jgi:hypothetical protein
MRNSDGERNGSGSSAILRPRRTASTFGGHGRCQPLNDYFESFAFTRSLRALPSTVFPSCLGRMAFMTAPISFIEPAPSFLIVSSIA